MEIIEFDKKFAKNVKDLLLELQEYIVSIDTYKLNMIGENFKDRYFKKTLREVKTKDGKIYIAVDNEQAVGMIAGFICPYYKSDTLDYSCPKKGIISEFIVSKEYRKTGVGKKLIQQMEKFFTSKQCEYCELGVFAYNESARKFYANNHYEERMITCFKKLN